MTKSREFVISEPSADADACVIWLHGLGADGSDFLGIADQLGLPKDHRVRFIFPNAAFRPVTVNNGMKMRAWYDIYDLTLLRQEDEQGIIASQQVLENIISHQLDQSIDSKRIMLAGFSQGAAMALYTGLRYPKPLAGIIALSGYLPLADTLNAIEFPVNQGIEIFMAHGLFDPVVPLNLGNNARQRLERQNYAVEWNTYPMVHTVIFEEIAAIGRFINRRLLYA